MTEKTGKTVRLVYKIAFSVISAVCAALLIAMVCQIYFGGGDRPYTREIMGEHLRAIAAPLIIWIALILAGFVLWEIFPPEDEKKNSLGARYTLFRLRKKLPVKVEGELLGEQAALERLEKIRKIVWYVCAGVCAVLAAAGLSYLLNFNNFIQTQSDYVTQEIISATIFVLPFIVCAFALCIGVVIYDGKSAKRELEYTKKLLKSGVKSEKQLTKFQTVLNNILGAIESERGIWISRGVVALVGVAFVIIGIADGGATDVLVKAINICTECIGLG